MTDFATYRLAFILAHSRQLLALVVGSGRELPTIEIPLFQRPAEELTSLIENKWNITTIVLDVLHGATHPEPCAVIEVRTNSWDYSRDGFATTSVSGVASSCLEDEERTSLLTILADGDLGKGPFSRLGWVDSAQSWIRASIKDHEVTFTENIRHLNVGGAFCLARFGTLSGPAYWLKAVGEPNTHEFAITTFLEKACPRYLPRIVAQRGDWNAWVMEEVGSSLHSSNSLEDFERAVITLADLQKTLIGRSEELLAARCGDHRIETLRMHIDEVIYYIEEAMYKQTNKTVPTLTPLRLKEIGRQLHQTCLAMQQLKVPDSLMHNDISPGSILSDGHNVVITDWCEAYVGNPFITLEQACVHFARKTDQPELWTRSLKSAYKSCWIEVLEEFQIDHAFQFAELISVFSYLYGRGDWLRSTRRGHDFYQRHTRSLARHMDRIASNPEFLEALCQVN